MKGRSHSHRVRARGLLVFLSSALIAAVQPGHLRGQADPASSALEALVSRFAGLPVVPGYEDAAAQAVLAALPGSRVDAAGNVVLVRGRGLPVRVAACPLDEPGHVVGGVTSEGYLTLRRAGVPPPGAVPERFLPGKRVTVFGSKGPVDGVVAVRSVHLQRGRSADPTPAATQPGDLLDELFVDVGAGNAAEAESLGIRPARPVTRTREPHRYGADLVAAPSAAGRASCAALLDAARRAGEPRSGTAVAAFTRRRWLGWDGMAFVLSRARELAGDVARGPGGDAERGEGADALLLGEAGGADSLGRGTVEIAAPDSAAFAGTGGIRVWLLPTRHAGSPVETVSLRDVAALAEGLRHFLEGAPGSSASGLDRPDAGSLAPARPPSRPGRSEAERVEAGGDGDLEEARRLLAELVDAYGVSGAEGPVREAVLRLLPDRLRPLARADSAGNLRLRLGSGPPLVVFVAHLDEIGYAVTGVREDGLLELEARGGFYGWLFEGETALVHTAGGRVPGVFVPGAPAVNGSGGFEDGPVPAPERPAAPEAQLLDLGVRSRAEAEALGVGPGDTATMPKRLVPLAGTRATARSLDDRVGCAAQILALRRIDPERLPHAVEFIWSAGEEVGLIGATYAAAELAPERPARVHAVDTFVSSDAPLERRTFAHAPLGAGAVIRAVDQSAVAPPALVDSLQALAGATGIPLQVGATGGGNDGSVFVPHGIPDVALAWPLRYSHSPAEVMDLIDLLALADLIRVIAERW